MKIRKYFDSETKNYELSVKCDKCGKIEKATQEETEKIFTRSLCIAGWKYNISRKIWICEKCQEKG